MLQYLKYIVLILTLVFLSCKTQQSTDVITFKSYFDSASIESWKDGVEYFRLNMDKNSVDDMLSIYLDNKFSSVKDKIEELLESYFTTFDPRYDNLLTLLENRDDNSSLLALVSTFEDQNIINFAKALYKQPASESKSKLSEDLGRTVLNLSYVKLLYNDKDKNVLLGTIFSAGYISGTEIMTWLVARILDNDSELSSNAIFALSKHGSSGFNLLANNLEELPSRLIIPALDILSFNKVPRLYLHLSALLIRSEPLLETQILKVYSTLGKTGYKYILEGLYVGDLEAQRYLIDLLVERDDPAFVDDILFLVNTKELQSKIVEICFKKERLDILNDLLFLPKYQNLNLGSLIVNYGLFNKSSLLFADKRISNYSLEFFLTNVSKEKVLDYFLALDFDDKYIRDYVLVFSIQQAIVEIKKVEDLRKNNSVIAKYFELESEQRSTDREAEEFYSAMRQWLSTRDDAFLDKSLRIKKSRGYDEQIVSDKKKAYFDTISAENMDILKVYEDDKVGIVTSYHQLTYRLKYLGQRIIYNRGFLYLIE